MSGATGRVTVTDHLAPGDVAAALRHDVDAGLRRTPKQLPPKWFYDEAGSELFDKITRLDEYYPTEAERAALRIAASEIVERSGATVMVELGSGSSDKTRVLLDALTATGRLEAYVPLDVSESALREAAASLSERYPALDIEAVVGDFDRHLGELPQRGHRLLAFLGGTIGNYAPAPRARLFAQMAATLRPGETLLLGTDLVKSADRLVRAYDDESGVTAAFNRNVLAVVNRELGAHFDLDRFEHVARWNAAEEWIEMWLRSVGEQRVRVAGLDVEVHFADGEEMLTEISAKFRRERLEAELADAGFDLIGWWTDPAGDFALSLSRRT